MLTWCTRYTGYITLLLVGWSCQAVTSVSPAETDDYFPLETGRYCIYDVSERRYSYTAAPESVTYQLKEVVGLRYADVTNQPAYRLYRYCRVSESQPWQLDSIWSTRRSGANAIRTENGRDRIKLVFPLVEHGHWNANQLTNSGADDYELRNIGQSFGVSGINFSETATVIQQADSTLIGQDIRREVYARSVGMIYKEVNQVQFCTASPGCIGKNQIEYGIQQTYRIRSYGRD